MKILRKSLSHLRTWKADPSRKVLLLRGARQVGKTFLVRELAREFKYVLEINFLSDRQAAKFFVDPNLDLQTLVLKLSTYFNIPIVDGETLLFFDEIQECPEAITRLRFFHEQRPALHVIAAGSLLEFALTKVSSFGVGRIDSVFMYPVTFDEYLAARGETLLLDYVSRAGPRAGGGGDSAEESDPIHLKLCELLHQFLFIGGLPAVVASFLDRPDYYAAAQQIDSIRTSFEDDFDRYRGRVSPDRLHEVLRSAALQAGKKFVFKHAYPDANSAQVDQALSLLNSAGLVHKIYHSAANGVPLGAEIDPKKFKAIPFDHGIYQRTIGVTPPEMIRDGLSIINKGALAEVFCGSELLGYANSFVRGELFYWHRESKSSNAEIDYLMQIGNKLIPIEVKSGTKGKMQSMNLFLAEKKRPLGVRVSFENFSKLPNCLIVPLYAIAQIERLVEEWT